MTTDAEIVIGVKGELSGARTVKRSLDDVADSGDRATRELDRMERQMGSLERQSRLLASAFKTFIVAFAVNELRKGVTSIISTAEEMRKLEARLVNSTRSVAEFNQAFKGLNQIAIETGGSLSASVEVFQRLSFSRDEIGATVNEMVKFTEIVQKLGVVSGASTSALQSGLLQLGQGLSSGVLRAEEFNSILENIPAVGVAIADELGVSVGVLRQMVLAGELLSKDVFEAILSQTDETNEKFANMPVTIDRAFGSLKAQFGILINNINQTFAATEKLANALQGVADNFARINGVSIEGAQTAYQNSNTIGSFYGGGLNAASQKALDEQAGIQRIDLDSISTALPEQDRKEMEKLLKQANEYNSLVTTALAGGKSSFYGTVAKEIKEAKEKTTTLSKAQKEAAKIQREDQAFFTNLIKETATEQELFNMRIDELEGKRGLAKTAEEIRAIDRAIIAAGDELEKFRLQAELDSPLAKTFARFAGEIEDGFKDAFKDAFTATEGGWKKLLSGFKETFKNLLAELAYQALARPIIVSVMGAAGGSLGISNSAVASTLGTSGGGFGGIGNLASLGGSVNSLFSGGSSALLTQGFDKVGGLFGFGNSGFIGPMQNGGLNGGLSQYSSLTNGSFGGAFGGALGGFAGNFGANALFGSDRGIGASIGGAIGGIAGSFIPVPVLGPMVGSFVGNAIGGLFGNSKPSNSTQYGSINFDTLERSGIGGLGGKKFSQANSDFRDGILSQAESLITLLKGAGATVSGGLYASIGSRDGYYLGDEGGANYKNYQDVDEFIKAVNDKILSSVSGLGATSQTILNNVGVSDLNALSQALEFGKAYDAYLKTPENLTDLEATMKALDDQYNQLASSASSLGLSVSGLTAKYNEQKQAIKDGFIEAIENEIMAIKDPAGLALSSLEDQFEALRKDAETLGLSKDKVEELYELRLDMLKAEEAGFRNLKDLADNLLDYLDGQIFSATSTLSPEQKLAEAQGQFDSLLSDARGGDYGAVGKITEAADLLLNTARDAYASSVTFAGIEEFVRNSLKNLGTQLDLPGFAVGTNSAPTGMAWVGENGPEIVNFKGGESVYTAQQSGRMNNMDKTNAYLAEMVQQNEDIKRDNAMLRKRLENLSAKMAVRG